jgi:hypothetical protein
MKACMHDDKLRLQSCWRVLAVPYCTCYAADEATMPQKRGLVICNVWAKEQRNGTCQPSACLMVIHYDFSRRKATCTAWAAVGW